MRSPCAAALTDPAVARYVAGMRIAALLWTIGAVDPSGRAASDSGEPLTACTCPPVADGHAWLSLPQGPPHGPPHCAAWLRAAAPVDRGPTVAAAAPAPAPAGDPPAPDIAAHVERMMSEMAQAYDKVRDYTTILHKRERVKGKLLPAEKLAIKFRKPYSIYIKWVGEVNQGQETIYVRGANGGKLRAHRGSFPKATLDLAVNHKFAMLNNRHPVTEASLGHVIDLISTNLRRGKADARGVMILRDAGESTRHGVRVRCIEAEFPADDYYGKKARVCVFVDGKLLSRIQIWDGAGRLVEDYEYEKLRVNVGLSARDFDSTNPAYDF